MSILLTLFFHMLINLDIHSDDVFEVHLYGKHGGQI